jgi:hypothetical protein
VKLFFEKSCIVLFIGKIIFILMGLSVTAVRFLIPLQDATIKLGDTQRFSVQG